MAALLSISIGHLCNSKLEKPAFHLSKTKSDPKTLFISVISCQNNDPKSKKDDEDKRCNKSKLQQMFGCVQRFGSDLQHNLSPQKKGDWKDVTLMSLSFAVYVYMSQKIVCAYFAWMYMIR